MHVQKQCLATSTRLLSSKYDTYETIQARFWPWLSETNPRIFQMSCLFARKLEYPGAISLRLRMTSALTRQQAQISILN